MKVGDVVSQEGMQADSFKVLVTHSYATVRVEGLRDAIAMPTFGSQHTDAIRMWTSVGSETTERRPTEDSNHPIILIGRLIMIGATFDSKIVSY